jgi:hypothetical protein
MLTDFAIKIARKPCAAVNFRRLTLTDTKKSLWVSPQLVRIGKIGDVAGTQPPATRQKSNGGTPCTPGNNCAFS